MIDTLTIKIPASCNPFKFNGAQERMLSDYPG